MVPPGMWAGRGMCKNPPDDVRLRPSHASDRPAGDGGPPCPICAGTTWRIRRRIRRRWLAQCSGCALLRTLPVPTDAGQDFAGGTGARFRLAHQEVWQSQAAARLDSLERLVRSLPAAASPAGWEPGQGMRLLDVGASIGTLVAAARARGWDAIGVDADAEACRLARQRGLPVHHGFFGVPGTASRTASIPPASADAVMVGHVVEHVPDPVTFLSAVRTVLRPGGIALLICPCAESLPARLLGRWWFGYVEEQHHWHLTPASLSACAALAGLSVVTADARHTLHYESAPLGPLLPLVRGVLRLARALDRGDEVWVVAQRSGLAAEAETVSPQGASDRQARPAPVAV